jgi:hypothetical protein
MGWSILGDGLVFAKLTQFAYQAIPFENPANALPRYRDDMQSGNASFPLAQHALEISCNKPARLIDV